MPYRFATSRQDYSDFASGGVFYHLPGQPAFPVRLATEIFQRCLEYHGTANKPLRVYDPCCGGAYHLAVLACLHWDSLAEICASDIDAAALDTAHKNLSLLTLAGLDRRIGELRELHSRFGKASHAANLESARRLRERLSVLAEDYPVGSRLFRADVFQAQAIQDGLAGRKIDLVVSDVPYGRISSWLGDLPAGNPAGPLRQMLESLKGILAGGAVVAVAAAKAQTCEHPDYRRLGRLKLGKRQVTFLAPA